MTSVAIECLHSRDKRPYFFNQTKGVFALQKSSTPADFSLFRDTNMEVATSYAYALYPNVVRFKPSKITVPELLLLLRFALF